MALETMELFEIDVWDRINEPSCSSFYLMELSGTSRPWPPTGSGIMYFPTRKHWFSNFQNSPRGVLIHYFQIQIQLHVYCFLDNIGTAQLTSVQFCSSWTHWIVKNIVEQAFLEIVDNLSDSTYTGSNKKSINLNHAVCYSHDQFWQHWMYRIQWTHFKMQNSKS